MPTRPLRPRPAARLLATAIALLVPLLLPAAASAHAWLRGPALTFADDPSAGFVGTFAGLGTDAAGTTSLAWVALDRATSTIEVRLTRIAPDGSAAPSLALGRTADVPALAVAPSGATAVAWPDEHGAPRLLTIPAGGAPRPAQAVATGPASEVEVGVSDAGDAVVLWEDGDILHVCRVAASGQLGAHETIGAGALEEAQVAVARDGSAWIAWIDAGDGDTPWAARLTPSGAIDGAPVQLTADGVKSLDLVAGADSAIATWTQSTGTDDKAQLRRLNPSGAVADAPLELAAIQADTVPEVAPAPGGAVDAVFLPPVPSGDGGPFATAFAVLRRIESSGAHGPERRLAAGPATLGSMSPRISAGSDDSATVTWLDVANDRIAIVGFQQRPDGTVTPTRTISGVFPLLGLDPTRSVTLLATSRLGVATAAWPEIGQRTASIATARYDGIAPVVDPAVPATVPLGSDASFAVTVRDDSGIASVWWEFGDDSGSRRAAARHRYADPGTYTVTVTVVDGAGNETTVSRQLTVVAPPPAATRVASGLKLGKVARKGAKVRVTGTLDRRASGTVTVAYSQRIGRRSHAKRVTATIARGRFAATLRLTGALAKARRGRATVKVSYAGDADTNAGSARKTVAVPKAKAKAKKPASKRKPRRR